MITLTDQEEELFKVLLDSRSQKGRHTVLRVAGGWVRDKILKRESDDVDIALDDQSGQEFASSLNEYLKSQGFETHKLAVITANPDQSKHIETAVVRVLGFSIDFVNLRSETYSEESRIPTIQYGSPAEDAERRDFTVNALFYNLDTRQVEDFTNKGLEDLKAGIIRTPVDPLITFRDDPLRVLRAIRFSSRYAFSFDDTLVRAARHKDIHSAMTHKVSRERVWKELKPMICNEANPTVRPLLAIASLFYFGIFGIVFCIPPELEMSAISMTTQGQEACADIDAGGDASVFVSAPVAKALETWQARSFETSVWYGVLLAWRRMSTPVSSSCPGGGERAEGIDMDMDIEVEGGVGGPVVTPRVVPVNELVAVTPELTLPAPSRVFYIASALSGLRGLQATEKRREVPLPTLVLRDSLKVDTDTLRAVQAVLDAAPSFQQYKDALLTHGVGSVFREDVGLLLRTVKDLWREAVWYACAEELGTLFSVSPESSLHTIWLAHINNSANEAARGGAEDERCHRWTSILFDVAIEVGAQDIMNGYIALEKHITSLGLDGCWDLRPLLDGNRLMKELPSLKKGPLIGRVMDAQLRWQLRNGPEGTVEELKTFLNSLLIDMNNGGS